MTILLILDENFDRSEEEKISFCHWNKKELWVLDR